MIVAALIGGLIPVIATNRLRPPRHDKRYPRWLWIIVGAVVGVLIFQSAWYYRDTFTNLFGAFYFERTKTISAEDDWQSTGTRLEKGQKFEVHASSERWFIGNTWINADGTDVNSYFSDVGLSAPRGSLVGKIGESSPFIVGTKKELEADNTGLLFFRVNDGNLEDNIGSITIKVKIWR